jgi:hypothetical protein
MRNSNGVPSQLGLPAESLGLNARAPDWAASLSVSSTSSSGKCGANLMEDNRIDD